LYYNFNYKDLANFIIALESGSRYVLHYSGDKLQDNRIITDKGVVTFSTYGNGDNDAVCFRVNVANEYCINAFQKLRGQGLTCTRSAN
jgi:hypothetical protein